MHQTAEIRNQ